jgi:hypothetical protein
MSKKKEIKKDLQKKLSAIVEIYVEQKGKARKKQLSDFIEKKLAEIVVFRNNLTAQRKIAKEKALNNNDAIVPKAAVLQPSPTLVDELHNHA